MSHQTRKVWVLVTIIAVVTRRTSFMIMRTRDQFGLFLRMVARPSSLWEASKKASLLSEPRMVGDLIGSPSLATVDWLATLRILTPQIARYLISRNLTFARLWSFFSLCHTGGTLTMY